MRWSFQTWTYYQRLKQGLPRHPKHFNELEAARVQTLRDRVQRLELAIPDPDMLDEIADRWEGSPDADYLRRLAARVRKYTRE